MKKMFLAAMLVLCVMPSTLQARWVFGEKDNEEKAAQGMERKKESQAFRKTLNEKAPKEKQAAIKQRQASRTAENKALQQGMHEKQMAELKSKLAQNPKLTEAQRSEILATREKQATGNKAYADQRRGENNAFFQNLSSDPTMTEEKKREAIRAHYQSQKPSSQAFRQKNKTESKVEREKVDSVGSPSAVLVQ